MPNLATPTITIEQGDGVLDFYEFNELNQNRYLRGTGQPFTTLHLTISGRVELPNLAASASKSYSTEINADGSWEILGDTTIFDRISDHFLDLKKGSYLSIEVYSQNNSSQRSSSRDLFLTIDSNVTPKIQILDQTWVSLSNQEDFLDIKNIVYEDLNSDDWQQLRLKYEQGLASDISTIRFTNNVGTLAEQNWLVLDRIDVLNEKIIHNDGFLNKKILLSLSDGKTWSNTASMDLMTVDKVVQGTSFDNIFKLNAEADEFVLVQGAEGKDLLEITLPQSVKDFHLFFDSAPDFFQKGSALLLNQIEIAEIYSFDSEKHEIISKDLSGVESLKLLNDGTEEFVFEKDEFVTTLKIKPNEITNSLVIKNSENSSLVFYDDSKILAEYDDISGSLKVSETIKFTSTYLKNIENFSKQIRLQGEDIASDPITLTDTLIQLKHIVGLRALTGVSFEAADITNDGKVDLEDVLRSLKHIVGLRPIFDFDIISASGYGVTELEVDCVGELTLSLNGDADGSHKEWALMDF